MLILDTSCQSGSKWITQTSSDNLMTFFLTQTFIYCQHWLEFIQKGNIFCTSTRIYMKLEHARVTRTSHARVIKNDWWSSSRLIAITPRLVFLFPCPLTTSVSYAHLNSSGGSFVGEQVQEDRRRLLLSRSRRVVKKLMLYELVLKKPRDEYPTARKNLSRLYFEPQARQRRFSERKIEREIQRQKFLPPRRTQLLNSNVRPKRRQFQPDLSSRKPLFKP